MELHSYAKRRTLKKWTIDQKRQLVEARIRHDAIFYNKPTNSVLPWKKIVSLAKLDDYNVFFVRRQWATMVAKYKQYKYRLGIINTRAIDDDMVRRITQEWEFFEPIHRMMTRRTTNLHSYALMHVHPSDMGTIKSERYSSPERVQVFSSDTNDEFVPITVSQQGGRNTDHDFYSKSASYHSNYFADASEDTQQSVKLEITEETTCDLHETEANDELIVESHVSDVDHSAQHHTQSQHTAHVQQPGSKPKLSERDKYYRHKRRFNRRLERRFDALLNVFGQIVKAEYPSVDVSGLAEAAAVGSAAVKHLFSSGEESADDDEASTDAEETRSNQAGTV